MNATTAVIVVVGVGLATAAYVLIKRTHGNQPPVQMQPAPAYSWGATPAVHGASPAQPATQPQANQLQQLAGNVTSAINTGRNLFNQAQGIFNTFKKLF